MNIKNIFKRRTKFTVYLKSGSKFVVKAHECNIERNTRTGELLTYEFKGLKPAHQWPLFLHIGQVEAITY